MSETASTPAAPAAPSSDTGPVIGPPPSSQPALTISEAGRLLSQQRRQASGAEPASPEAATRKPSPQSMVDGTAQKAAEAAAPPPAPAKPAEGLTALERALGVPGTPAEGEAPAAPADIGASVEIEGRHYTQTELREAVLKASDYTRKTQELAQQRQALAAQQKAFADVLPVLQPELQRLAQVWGDPQPPDPALAQTDPTRYVQERAVYDAAMAEQQRFHNITAQQQQAQERAMQEAIAAGNEALAKEFPFWNDPTERSAAQQQIVTWALDKGGFNRDELRGLTDPRHLKVMMKAMAYDKWVTGAKTTAPQQRLAAPVRGAPPPPAPTERIQVAEQRFDARPNIRTGAALLAARRGNGASH